MSNSAPEPSGVHITEQDLQKYAAEFERWAEENATIETRVRTKLSKRERKLVRSGAWGMVRPYINALKKLLEDRSPEQALACEDLRPLETDIRRMLTTNKTLKYLLPKFDEIVDTIRKRFQAATAGGSGSSAAAASKETAAKQSPAPANPVIGADDVERKLGSEEESWMTLGETESLFSGGLGTFVADLEKMLPKMSVTLADSRTITALLSDMAKKTDWLPLSVDGRVPGTVSPLVSNKLSFAVTPPGGSQNHPFVGLVTRAKEYALDFVKPTRIPKAWALALYCSRLAIRIEEIKSRNVSAGSPSSTHTPHIIRAASILMMANMEPETVRDQLRAANFAAPNELIIAHDQAKPELISFLRQFNERTKTGEPQCLDEAVERAYNFMALFYWMGEGSSEETVSFETGSLKKLGTMWMEQLEREKTAPLSSPDVSAPDPEKKPVEVELMPLEKTKSFYEKAMNKFFELCQEEKKRNPALETDISRVEELLRHLVRNTEWVELSPDGKMFGRVRDHARIVVHTNSTIGKTTTTNILQRSLDRSFATL